MKKLIPFFIVMMSFNVNANKTNTELQFLLSQEKQKSKYSRMENTLQHNIKNFQNQYADKMPNSAKERHDPNLIIFASLGMPKSSLEAILIQANELNASVLIRGIFPESEGGFKGTVHFIRQLLTEDGHKKEKDIVGGVSIDPNRFKQFGIKKVPVYVLVEKDACVDYRKPCNPKDFDVLTGNITPISALHEFEQRGDHQSIARMLLSTLNHRK